MPLRCAFLDCEDAPLWAGFPCVGETLLPDACWTTFRAFERSLPDLADLAAQFDGILVSGSHCSVADGALAGECAGGGVRWRCRGCWR